MKFSADTWAELIKVAHEKEVYIEGNVLKVIDTEGVTEYVNYVNNAITLDKSARRRRLDVTKQIQAQNKQLTQTKKELQNALAEADRAKQVVEQDLDALQKKTQNHMIKQIIKVALIMIVGVGLVTSLLYGLALVANKNADVLGNAWSAMLGIILTNSFSIIGTVVGIRYANDDKNKSD